MSLSLSLINLHYQNHCQSPSAVPLPRSQKSIKGSLPLNTLTYFGNPQLILRNDTREDVLRPIEGAMIITREDSFDVRFTSFKAGVSN